MADDIELLNQTIVFLRMAAIEIRHLAESAPEIADGLHHIAAQCDAQAADLRNRKPE
jgi:hypothetical protein